MKKITFFLALLLSASAIIAQAPSAFSYQAVVRDSTGAILTNQNVHFNSVL